MGIAFAYVYIAAPAWLAVPSRKACLSSVQDKRSRATLKSAVVVLPMFSCHVPMLSALAYTNGACARTPKGVSKKGNSSRAEHSTAQASGAESRRRRAASEPFQERCLHNANTAAFAAALSRPGTASMFPTSRSEVTPATDCSLHGFMCFATTHCLRRRPRSALPPHRHPVRRPRGAARRRLARAAGAVPLHSNESSASPASVGGLRVVYHHAREFQSRRS